MSLPISVLIRIFMDSSQRVQRWAMVFILFFALILTAPLSAYTRDLRATRTGGTHASSDTLKKNPHPQKQEKEKTKKKKKEEKDEELEKLLKELEELPEPEKKEKKEKEKRSIQTSGALNLNRLNPEISLTGDLIGFHNFEREFRLEVPDNGGPPQEPKEFEVREIEFGFVSMLDPYSRMKVFVSYENGELSLEEAYAQYLSIPGGLRLSVGRQFQQVGMLNRWHQHALPWVDRPPAMVEFLGEDNLSQTGLHVAWLLPKWVTSSGELVAELLFGDSPLFDGSRLTRPAWTVYLNNYQDLSDETFFEFGGSVAGGFIQDDPPLRNTIFNAFARFNWTPKGAAKYRGLDVWGEVFINRRDVLPSPSTDANISRTRWGGFLFTEYRLNQRLIAGMRLDYLKRFNPINEKEWWVTPYLTIWQTEWVRLRIQYTWMHTHLRGNNSRVMVQLTWAAGPHKHEAY